MAKKVKKKTKAAKQANEIDGRIADEGLGIKLAANAITSMLKVKNTKAQASSLKPDEANTMAKGKKPGKSSAVNKSTNCIDQDNSDSALHLDLPCYKEDINAFSAPKQPDVEHDHISSLPSEMLDRVLSYLVLDHEPDLGVRQKAEGYKFRDQDHVLISLAAMSRHFRDHVESFCKHQLIIHAEDYRYRTNEMKDAGKRRSPRLQAKPIQDSRVYRMELVRHLKYRCVSCNAWTSHRATRAAMANKVWHCWECEKESRQKYICLTDAIAEYGLRDYMLLKSRKPGPRAKFTDLPPIAYGTKLSNVWFGLFVGKAVLTYVFWRKDVENLARLVHGNWEAHMEEKKEKSWLRKMRNIDKRKRLRMLDFHTAKLKTVRSATNKSYHRQRIEHFKDKDCDVSSIATTDEDYPLGPKCYNCGGHGCEYSCL